MRLEEWLADSLLRPGNPARPSVTLSYAQSLDGSIALRRGERLALSGPESHKLTHLLRASHDAILVGIGTVLSDDPQLTARLVEGNDPHIIVLDSRLRTPTSARLLKGKPRIFCAASASREAQGKLEKAGAIVERQADEKATLVNLRVMLEKLKQIGINSVMVEGGGEIISSFLNERLVDRLILTVAPQFVGGYKGLNLELKQMPSLQDAKVERYGNDLVIWGKIAIPRRRPFVSLRVNSAARSGQALGSAAKAGAKRPPRNDEERSGRGHEKV